ncbi:MAG: MFS transporter [Acidimicrobiales bacterium]
MPDDASAPGAGGASGEVPDEGTVKTDPWATRGTVAVAASSLFSDSGHELTTALLPSFLVSVLHASAGALGVIEGISDGLLGLAKLWGGPRANDRQRRGRLASAGYLGTAIATGAIGLTTAAWQTGLLRALAWVARGARSPARDSLLASLTSPKAAGRAFGLERAGDNLGAVAGPLLAAVLLRLIGIRSAMLLAAVPGSLAAISITVAVREARAQRVAGAPRASFELAKLRRAGLLRAMVPVGLFETGNVASTLLILRATQLLHTGGRPLVTAASLAILVYAGHNAVASVVALVGGHWIDKSGPRIVFAAGAICYVVGYAGFAVGPRSWPLLLLAFSFAGSGIGLAETSESVLVAGLLPDELRGAGFGLLGGVQSGGGLAASIAVGLIYEMVSPRAGFAYAASWMVLAALGAALLRRSR